MGPVAPTIRAIVRPNSHSNIDRTVNGEQNKGSTREKSPQLRSSQTTLLRGFACEKVLQIDELLKEQWISLRRPKSLLGSVDA